MPSRDEDLMLYVDGELPAREAHELEKRFASGKDGDDKAKLEGLRQVGDVVRARYEAAVEEAEPRFADMWARLDAALTPAPAPVASLGARLAAWWHNFRSHVLVGATCAAAGAVLVFVVMHQAHTRELVARGCQVMLSNSDTPFIRSLYKGFRVDRVKCPRAINSNAAKRGDVDEVIITAGY